MHVKPSRMFWSRDFCRHSQKTSPLHHCIWLFHESNYTVSCNYCKVLQCMLSEFRLPDVLRLFFALLSKSYSRKTRVELACLVREATCHNATQQRDGLRPIYRRRACSHEIFMICELMRRARRRCLSNAMPSFTAWSAPRQVSEAAPVVITYGSSISPSD
jgi:hypothetical protein